MRKINPKKPGTKPPFVLRFIANTKCTDPKPFGAALATRKLKFLTTILHKFVVIFISDWSIGSRLEARTNIDRSATAADQQIWQSVIFREIFS